MRPDPETISLSCTRMWYATFALRIRNSRRTGRTGRRELNLKDSGLPDSSLLKVLISLCHPWRGFLRALRIFPQLPLHFVQGKSCGLRCGVPPGLLETEENKDRPILISAAALFFVFPV